MNKQFLELEPGVKVKFVNVEPLTVTKEDAERMKNQTLSCPICEMEAKKNEQKN